MPDLAINKLKSFIERGPSDVAESLRFDKKIVREVIAALEDGKLEDPELEQAMKDFDPANNPPKWANKATWERAKRAVDPKGKGAKYSNPWAVVAHVYRKMGGQVA